MRFSSQCSASQAAFWLAAQLLLTVLSSACGTDAERRYAGLSTKTIETDGEGYRLRYLAPPWEALKDDPLVLGTRTGVPVGGVIVPIVPGSAAVLEVDRASTIPDEENLSYPKYRLEAALVTCAEVSADATCAEQLAEADFQARAAEGSHDLLGPAPRAGKNDFGQQYHELMGKVDESGRYRRVVFFETSQPSLAARLFIEGNPNLDEREITNLIRAFEPLDLEAEP